MPGSILIPIGVTLILVSISLYGMRYFFDSSMGFQGLLDVWLLLCLISYLASFIYAAITGKGKGAMPEH